jgi:hypothetical protein
MRGLRELTIDSLETTLDLINQQNLYRGEEFKRSLEDFLNLKILFSLYEEKSDLFCWYYYRKRCSNIRNSAIGTLLIDLSKDLDLDQAVRKYESIVAPQNYQRPTALVSPRMIEQARQKIQELGLESTLHRRVANYEDLDINQVIYVNRASHKPLYSVFDTVQADLPVQVSSFSRSPVISPNQLITEILPANLGADVSILFEKRHTPNLVTLVTGEPGLFKWDNGFSWSYGNGLADSFKERVKKAGGQTDGFFRFSLIWSNTDDLDLHVNELFPGGSYIKFDHKLSAKTKGCLDVDMNVHGETSEPVENIIYNYQSSPVDGLYEVFVDQYRFRQSTNVGFTLEAVCEEFDQRYTFEYPKKVLGRIHVGKFSYSKKEGLKLEESSLKSTENLPNSTKIWNLGTNKFHKVSTMTFSPNHWGDSNIGNKHLFFFVEGTKSEEETRGIFNEYLRADLNENRKAFELVGGKIPVQKVDNELSGLGFSLSKTDQFLVKVNQQVYQVKVAGAN